MGLSRDEVEFEFWCVNPAEENLYVYMIGPLTINTFLTGHRP
jgi:hypothetical protein